MGIYVVPDIHAQYYKLINVFDKVKNKITNDDLIIFLGDYIDRGKLVKETIEYLINIKSEYNCKFLMGNHEQMMLLSIGKGDYDILKVWISNGGDSTLHSYGVKHYNDIIMDLGNLPTDHRQFFLELEQYYETDNYFFVHAGVNLEFKFEDNTLDDFLWIRPPFFLDKKPKYPINKIIVHGHTISRYVVENKYHIGLDLGSYLPDGHIVIYDLINRKVIAQSD